MWRQRYTFCPTNLFIHLVIWFFLWGEGQFSSVVVCHSMGIQQNFQCQKKESNLVEPVILDQGAQESGIRIASLWHSYSLKPVYGIPVWVVYTSLRLFEVSTWNEWFLGCVQGMNSSVQWLCAWDEHGPGDWCQRRCTCRTALLPSGQRFSVLSVALSNKCVSVSVCLLVCLPICLFSCSVHLSFCLSVFPLICCPHPPPPVCLPICPSVCPTTIKPFA